MEVEIDCEDDNLRLVDSNRNQCSNHILCTYAGISVGAPLGRFVTKVRENPKLTAGLLAIILIISVTSFVCSSRPGHHYLSYYETLEFLSEAATSLFPNATLENIGNFFALF